MNDEIDLKKNALEREYKKKLFRKIKVMEWNGKTI